MTILITGATGAVGTHVQIQLDYKAKVLDLRGYEKPEPADHVMHLAGINRGTAEELVNGNAGLAQKFVDSLTFIPKTLTFANSVKALTDITDYSEGKRLASWILMDWCRANGVEYRNAYLPNLMGKFGKPNHNMIATTIAEAVKTGSPPPQVNDKPFRMGFLRFAARELIQFDRQPADIKTYWTTAKDLLISALELKAGRWPETPIEVELLEMLEVN